MALYPVGPSTLEGVANGATPFVTDDRYTCGIVFARERGPLNKPVLISSLSEDQQKFGGHINGAYGSHVIEDIYNNAAAFGFRYYGVRVADASSAAAATGAVTYNTGVPTITSQIVQAAAAGIKQIRYVFFANVSVGDELTIEGVDLLVSNASPYEVAKTFATLLAQDATVAATYDVSYSGAILIIAHKTVNTAFTLTTSVTAAAASGVSLMTNIKAAQEGSEDPGTWGNKLQIILYPFGVYQKDLYGAEVLLNNARVEQWTAQSYGELVEKINGSSQYVMIVGYNAGHAPVTTITKVFSGGTYVPVAGEAGMYPVSSDSAPVSFGALDNKVCSIVFCTEFFTGTFAVQVRNYAERTRRIGVVCTPHLASSGTIAGIVSLLQNAGTNASHVAVYKYWGEVPVGSQGSYIWIPAFGAIIGAGFIRVPRLNNDKIHFAPAGEESYALNYRKVWPENPSRESITSEATNNTLNVPITMEGKGTFLITSRTMSTNELYHSIHVRRKTNYWRNVLEASFLKYAQKPNTPETDAFMAADIVQYFKTEWDDGALERSIPFEQACIVTIDQSNNPKGQSRKLRFIDIAVIPSECLESIVIRLNRNDGALITSVIS